MEFETRLLKPEEVDGYDALAAAHGRIFYSPEWRAIFGSALQLHGVFNGKGSLIGGFQLLEERRAGVRFLRNPPFTPVCGPLCRIEARQPVAVLEAKRDVLDAMARRLTGPVLAITSLSLDHDVIDALPFWWRGFKVTPRFTYQIDLGQSAADIVKAFSATRRNDISKAKRDGLTVALANDPRVVFDLVKGTFDRTRGRLDAEVLERILFQFARPENSFGYVVCRDGRPIACTFIVHDRRTAYYLLGGYDQVGRHHGAGALAITESIQESQRRGLGVFDFEGSSIPAIERFFRGFGGQLVHYFTVNRAWLPCEMVLKLRKRSLF